jgi:hypothetical protein
MIAAFATCFANVDHDASDAILQWCGRELGRGFVTRAFDAVRTARVLVSCDAHGLPGRSARARGPGDRSLTEQLRGRIVRRRVAETLDGLVALRRLAG